MLLEDPPLEGAGSHLSTTLQAAGLSLLLHPDPEQHHAGCEGCGQCGRSLGAGIVGSLLEPHRSHCCPRVQVEVQVGPPLGDEQVDGRMPEDSNLNGVWR